MQNEIIVHTDGGSRGNPGPAASGFVIEMGGEIVYSGSKYLGNTTNNVAEYSAVILALEWLHVKPSNYSTIQQIVFFLDSELVVRQLTGVYKVKDENLRSLYFKVLELVNRVGIKVIFKHIPREQNKEADFLVNQELDKKHLICSQGTS